MDEVISLDQRRRARATRAAAVTGTPGPLAPVPAVGFAFDLSSPWTYLAAERVDRLFPGATWQPVAPAARPTAVGHEHERPAVVARAAALHMPLVWPERSGGSGRAATRVAAWAAAEGRAPAFVLAATRLAFCGGFDLDEPEVLAEAAAAAGLNPEACLHAAGDPVHEAAVAATGRRLRGRGADRLPVLSVGEALFCGEERLAEAAAARRDPWPGGRRAPSDGRAS